MYRHTYMGTIFKLKYKILQYDIFNTQQRYIRFQVQFYVSASASASLRVASLDIIYINVCI